MNGYNSLIKYFRNLRNITMEELADGICTRQYIYLLESGKRSPNVEIVDQIGAKLDVDLKEFLEYADYENPIFANTLISNLKNTIFNEDYNTLKKLLEEAAGTELYEKYPTCVAVKVSEVVLMFNNQECLEKIKKQIYELMDYLLIDKNNICNAYQYTIHQLRVLILYGRLLVKQNKLDDAVGLLKELKHDMEIKKTIKAYEDTYITICIDWIKFMSLKDEDFNEMKSINDLYNYTKNRANYKRLHMILLMIGDAHYKLGEVKTAKEYFSSILMISRTLGLTVAELLALDGLGKCNECT